MLERLDTLQHRAELGRVLRDVEPQLARLHDDVAPAGEVADQNVTRVPDKGRIDVFVAPQQLLHRVHVRSTFVGERGGAHPRQARVRASVRDFVDKLRELGERGQRLGRHRGRVELERQVRYHRGEVAVSSPFAVAVQRSLDMGGAGLERGQRVGEAQADVVMRVDAEPGVQVGTRLSRDFRDLARHGSAIGVAQRDHVGARTLGGLPRGERVLRIVLVAIERVLGVVHDELSVLFQASHRVGHHRQVLFRRGLQYVMHVQQPGLSVDGDDGRSGREQ